MKGQRCITPPLLGGAHSCSIPQVAKSMFYDMKSPMLGPMGPHLQGPCCLQASMGELKRRSIRATCADPWADLVPPLVRTTGDVVSASFGTVSYFALHKYRPLSKRHAFKFWDFSVLAKGGRGTDADQILWCDECI